MKNSEARLYGVPIGRLQIAVREQLELMAFGDEEIRRILHQHPLEFLIRGINSVISLENVNLKDAMTSWLIGELTSKHIPLSRKLGQESLNGMKETLNAAKENAKAHRGQRTRGTS